MQVSYYLLSAVSYDIHIKQIYFEGKGHVSIWQLVLFWFFLFLLSQESAAVVIFLCFTALNSFEETFHFFKKKQGAKRGQKK